MRYFIECTGCAARYGRDSAAFRCEKCNGVLEVKYDYSTLVLPDGFRKEKPSQAKYAQFYPVDGKLVSLGEGGSELVKATDIGTYIEESVDLRLKIETGNPTRTFKDRGTSIEMSKALELGFDAVCCASTGNMGLSVATYAKRLGLKCRIYMSKSGNKEKMAKIEAQGAELVRIDGDFNDAINTAEKYAEGKKVFLCGDYHFRKEGQKSMAYEIIEQLGYDAPDYLFLQVGNGTLFAAMYKGFNEFKSLGLIRKVPRLVAVQSLQCDPLVRAYKNGTELVHVEPRTRADAIAVGFPVFGFECINAIKATGGDAIAVHDKSIDWTVGKLNRHMGIKSELGGAAGLTGFLEMYGDDMSRFENKTVVSIITGNNED